MAQASAARIFGPGIADFPLIPVAMQYRRMLSVALALLGSGMAYKSHSFSSMDADDSGNPIRKVVSMMERMGKKIEEEGKHEEDLYDKFKCYCKKTMGELEASIQQQQYNPVPQLPQFKNCWSSRGKR